MKSTHSQPATKKILLLSANPKPQSFTESLALAYFENASKENEVKRFHLADMDFDPNLSHGYDKDQPLEESLKAFQSAITWCDHLVIITPIWWGGLPAKLKGLFDRTFLPGFAFQYEGKKALPKQLLKGKTARIVMLMDSPPWYYRLTQGAPALGQLKSATLKFVGFKSVKTNMVGPIVHSSVNFRKKWIDQVSKLGQLAA